MGKELMADDFLFSGMDANNETLSVFDKKTTNNDGIYRPNLKEAKDKKIGYRATLRFLPNMTRENKMGHSAIEKHIHYVDMKNDPQVSGYYECRKNNEPNCELCTEHWKLKNSKNAADNEKSELLKRTTKYYSYVMIIEDEQHPDLVGKILIWPYGYTIAEKIKSEKNGELTGESIDVFNLNFGKDFRLIIKEKGGFQNYEASSFLEKSPIKLYDEASSTFKTAPVNENGLITNPKVQVKIKEFLLGRTVEIDEHKAKVWDEAVKSKVTQLIDTLNGNDNYVAEQRASKAGSDATHKPKATNAPKEAVVDDEFFNLSED